MKSQQELEEIANFIRRDIVKLTYNSGIKGAHLGGALSLADILAVLYGSIIKYDTLNPEWDERDRIILSKAHAAIGLYASLHYAGFLNEEDIAGAMHGESSLYEHPKKSLKYGIEFSGGSLGQGLSLGVGTALALKMKKSYNTHVYVILGDGECNEGSVWEAAEAAGKFELNNMTVIIDANGLQYDGITDVSGKLSDSLKKRWEGFGFFTKIVDGHNVLELQEALNLKTEKPYAIIAKTIKGKGISFAENVVDWHTGRLTDELYKQAMEELNV